jgi:hypothetical protein
MKHANGVNVQTNARMIQMTFEEKISKEAKTSDEIHFNLKQLKKTVSKDNVMEVTAEILKKYVSLDIALTLQNEDVENKLTDLIRRYNQVLELRDKKEDEEKHKLKQLLKEFPKENYSDFMSEISYINSILKWKKRLEEALK